MNYSSLLLGHVTMDTNTDHLGNVVHAPGGAVLFSSASAFALGHDVAVVTKASEKGKARLAAFTIPADRIFCAPALHDTEMVNTYFTADKEKRRSVCAEQGDPIAVSDVPAGVTADIYHLAGLLVGDYAPDLIPALARRGDVAVDVQGFLRRRDPQKGGEMYFADWKEKKELLPLIRFLKTDAAEAEILTGTKDRAEAARQLAAWGAKEVLITHNTEVLVYADGRILTCPIRARSLSGRTGRGDTTFAAYINERRLHAPAEALLTATATVSLKMETPGPFRGTRDQVERKMEEMEVTIA
ncbi:MAG: ribokinase [Clostridia bacterium]|nr:ribokinase [Clostridia bacterium]MBR0537247.1 ribokinase [Clostridia bacterium]